MKKLLLSTLLAALSLPALADKLDDIKAAGVVRVAVFDSNPPFGFLDAQSRQLAGFDVEIAGEIARKLGVKLALQPTNPANRIPLLQTGKVDLIAANFTITDARRQQVNFSVPYFATGQKFIARKGVLRTPADIAKLRIGVDRGTTQEVLLREKYPQTAVVAYDDTPLAFAALRNSSVQAITQDDAKLIALLGNAPDRDKFEISPFALTREYQGIGLPRGEDRLTKLVNDTLHELEKSGQLAKIYQRWFGPSTKAPLPRDFKVGDAS